MNQESQKDRQAKNRRASRACLSCRARKVRCNAIDCTPCSNCRWDGTKCVVPRTRRSRKILHEPLQEAADAASDDVVFVGANTVQTDNQDPSLINTDSLDLGDTDESPSDTWPVQDFDDNTRLPMQEDTLADSLISHSLITTPGSSQQLPAFISPPSIPNSGYHSFLTSQGVFTLPHVSLQCKLLQSFIEIVYPRMPLLNLEYLLTSLRSPDGSGGQVSLMLYTGILYAGSIHVDLDTLREHGYMDRKSLKKTLYKHAELLFDFEAEQDRLASIQTALLLTCRGVSEHERKDSWHWINTAISLGYTINLHRNVASRSLPVTEQKLRRRIWWCCYVRDSILAIGMHRPTRIKDHDFDVPMLEVADMEYDLLTRQHNLLNHDHIGPFNKIKQLESAELCIQKSRLCIIINHIIQMQGAGSAETEQRAGFSCFQSQSDGVDGMERALLSWKKSLPQSCRYQPLVDEFRERGTAPVDVRRHLLHMAYYTAVYTLHRPRILPNSPQSFMNTGLTQAQERSKTRVLEAADNITRLAGELQQNDMDRNLPLSAITVICPALSIHLLNMKSQSQDVRSMAIVNFQVCMKTMEKLKKLYSAAEVTVNFLEIALGKVSTPSLSPSMSLTTAGGKDKTDVWTVLNCALPPQTESRITDLDAGDQVVERHPQLIQGSSLEASNNDSNQTSSTESQNSMLGPFSGVGFDFDALEDMDNWTQGNNMGWASDPNFLDRPPLSPLTMAGVDLNYNFSSF